MVKRASVNSIAQRESVWRDRLARFAASEQRVEAFCQREAVSVASFYNWRKRLRGSRGRVLTAPPIAPLPVTSPFIDLGSVGSGSVCTAVPAHAPTTDYPSTAINIRLDLGGGVVLHIARH